MRETPFMVVDVHFQVVELAFETLERGEDDILTRVHRVDRGRERSNGRRNSRHHLFRVIRHGCPHPCCDLFREHPNFVVLAYKDSSNFGEAYVYGSEKDVVVVVCQSGVIVGVREGSEAVSWRRWRMSCRCRRCVLLPATGCVVLKNPFGSSGGVNRADALRLSCDCLNCECPNSGNIASAVQIGDDVADLPQQW